MRVYACRETLAVACSGDDSIGGDQDLSGFEKQMRHRPIAHLLLSHVAMTGAAMAPGEFRPIVQLAISGEEIDASAVARNHIQGMHRCMRRVNCVLGPIQ
eukprot:5332913-Pyramimonas_sp.AAC.1